MGGAINVSRTQWNNRCKPCTRRSSYVNIEAVVSVIVPPSGSYVVTNATLTTINRWLELS
jgi:hypothetical protein